MASTVGKGTEVRPSRVDVPEEELAEMRRPLAATRWPYRETVPDRSQGAQLAELQGRGKTIDVGKRMGGAPARGGPLSRKRFLAGSAALLGGGALVAALPKAARAHETPEPPTDIDVLNYALTLEHLEYAFYLGGLRKFGRREFENAGIFDGLGRHLRDRAYKNFVRIRENEGTHVETFRSVILDLGGIPVPKGSYNFEQTAFTSVGRFVSVAQFLENTGVSAFNGAISHIEAAGLLTAGATVATVEARHASYLNLLNKDEPFPKAFDGPTAPRAICEAVQAENGGFIVSTPKPYGPYRSLDALCAKLPNIVTPS